MSKRMLLLVLLIVCSTCGNVQSDPIVITKETFANCRPGDSFGVPTHCCPIQSEGPVLEFIPKRDRILPVRERKALQCLTGEELATYTEKLAKAYELMRALPDTDPRSFERQNGIHCSYGSGAFPQDGTNNTIDVHLNWYFVPWHRMYVYFHERILQALLNDTTFSLHYWNFDNGLDGSSSVPAAEKGCFKPGHFFPEMYMNRNITSLFHENRTARSFNVSLPADLTLLSRTDLTERVVEEAVPRNRELMHRALEAGNSTRDFFGVEFRHGQVQPLNLTQGGSLEFLPHNSMHRWIGGSVGFTPNAPEDPIFFPFHSNVDRLWAVWLKLGWPRQNPSDPDWLKGEFLFYDENAVLRSIKVSDSLELEDFGYTYERVFDESWILYSNNTDSSPMNPVIDGSP